MPSLDCTETQAAKVFRRRSAARPPRRQTQTGSVFFMMEFFGTLDAEKNWTKQASSRALRDPNSRIAEKLGADTGCDAIGDFPQGAPLARYLDRP